MAKLWKCYNCDDPKRSVPGRDFTADKPVCPTCGLDGADPQVAHKIVQRRLIHFEPPHAVAADCGSGKLACGAKPVNVQITRAVVAANCSACLASEAGKAAVAAAESTADDVPNPADFLVSVDPQNHQIVKAEG